MEHRWDRRHPLDIPLTLLVPGQGVVRVQSRDISLGGINIHCPGVVLRRNTLVSVVLSLREGDTLFRHALQALIVHTADNSAGLMFMDVDLETVHVVNGLLNATPPRAALPFRTPATA